MHLLKLVAAVMTASVFGVAAAQADTPGPPWGPETPHFNLEVILRPAAGGPDNAFGHVKFRQPNDAAKIIYLDAWVRDLAQGQNYSLQRRVDTAIDGECKGTMWGTLGAVPVDDSGTGRAALSRDVSTIPLGMQFDIQFRVVVTGTDTAVLESGCYTYTVSQ